MTFHYWKHMLLLLVIGPVFMFLGASPQCLHFSPLAVAVAENVAMGSLAEDALLRLAPDSGEAGAKAVDLAALRDSIQRTAKRVSSQEKALAMVAETWKAPNREVRWFEFRVLLYLVLIAFLMSLLSWREDMRLARIPVDRANEPSD